MEGAVGDDASPDDGGEAQEPAQGAEALGPASASLPADSPPLPVTLPPHEKAIAAMSGSNGRIISLVPGTVNDIECTRFPA